MIGNLQMTSNLVMACPEFRSLWPSLSLQIGLTGPSKSVENRKNGPVCPIVPIPETPVLVTFVTRVSVVASVLSASSPIVKGYVSGIGTIGTIGTPTPNSSQKAAFFDVPVF
jgi:hypothetical protein